MMMPSGMHSQTLSKSERTITSAQRDSAYYKIQRGKVAEEKVKVLNSALAACDSAKHLYIRAIGIQDARADSLSLVIIKGKTISHNLESINKDMKKKYSRSSFWLFLKGTALGAAIMAVLVVVL